jgi:hypothetical protein
VSGTKKPQLHPSGVNMYNFCGEQYRRAYIEKEKRPPGVSAHVGTGTDRGVTANLGNKILRNELLPRDEVLQIAREGFEEAWETGFLLSDEEKIDGIKKVKGDAIDKTMRLSSVHYKDLAPVIRPTHVQRSFTVSLDGYPVDIAGTIDVQEDDEGIVVRDTKTMAKAKSQAEADSTIQLSAYGWALKVNDGEAPDRYTLDCLVDTKVPKSVVLTTKRTDRDFDAFLARVENVVEGTEKGIFVPVKAGDPLCSPKFCGYYSTCRYVRNPVQIAIP